ncbi:MAG TPA: glycerol-3-phosphate acyltransferase [Anaerolineae bacterium]
MENIVYFLAIGLLGYVCGAIPFGYLYVKWRKGIDIREIGSGRTGGTNSFRAAGLGVGVVTSVSDVFKGFIAVTLARLLLSGVLNETLLPWALVTAGVMAVVGHNWSVFLGWGGGAGTGPNVGWATALWWPMLPIAFVIMVVFFLGVGMASVASLAMAAVIPTVFTMRYVAGLDQTPAYMVGGFAAAAVVIWALRPNIKRLLNGTERLVGPRAKHMKNAEG